MVLWVLAVLAVLNVLSVLSTPAALGAPLFERFEGRL